MHRNIARAALALASLPLALLACHGSSGSGSPPLADPLVVNRALAVQQLFGDGVLRLGAASEADQGVDLDGDGDATDLVLHVLDLESGAVTNTGLALPERFRRDEVPPPEFGCNDALGVFQVSEAATGQDLDEDGVPDEVASWTFNRRTGRLGDLPFAHAAMALGGDLAAFLAYDSAFVDLELSVFDGRDGSLTTLAVEPYSLYAARDGLVAFARAEEGAFDLNADGDADDFSVLHLYDADSHRTRNASLEVAGPGVAIRAGFAASGAFESRNGGLDLNGDGDADDDVFVAVRGSDGLTRIPGFSGATFADFPVPSRDLFLLTVREDGLDRNGDGDADDPIALVYDPVADRALDTGLAAIPSLVQAGPFVGVPVDEAAQGHGDLDGDGRLESHVLFVFDTRTERSVSLGFNGFFLAAVGEQLLGLRFEGEGATFRSEFFAWDGRTHLLGFEGGGVLGATEAAALLLTPEHDDDLNGDGDTDDLVLALYDARAHAVRSLELAAGGLGSHLGPQGRAAVLVSEPAQGGADLNGDGDALDLVLHEILLAP